MAAIPSPESGLPGLLRLTPDTRRLIYEHAGLAYRRFYDGQQVPAFYNLGDSSSFTAWREAYAPDEFETFHGLLLSCRTVYREASALLYSANWFTIRYQSRRTLASLRALTPHALAHLTQLKVVLNESSCHEEKGVEDGSPGCCITDDPEDKVCCNSWGPKIHNPPLSESVTLCSLISAEWNATAVHLAAHIIPGRLELHLVCDVVPGDLGAARRALLDGLRLLPPLKDCHIRLCDKRDPALLQLAHEAVLHARGIAPREPPGTCSRTVGPSATAPAPPRLLMLPPELRLRVLEYTDLVTPWNEISWTRSSGYTITRALCEKLMSGNDCPKEFHVGCRFSQCQLTTRDAHPSMGCFCRRRHSVASSHCQCWAPPTALFLVCRALYAEATRVLYSQNRFIVFDGPGGSKLWPFHPRDYPDNTFAASHFLRHAVPRHCLRHLRFLEVVFAAFTHAGRPRVGHPAFQDWVETLDWAKHELNLPALTVRLVMARSAVSFPEDSHVMTQADGRSVLDVYDSILQPLRRLDPTSPGGLARFYAELSWPLRYTPAARRKPPGWLEGKERELKRRAEQYVMAERYESVCVTAEQPLESVWIRRVLQESQIIYH